MAVSSTRPRPTFPSTMKPVTPGYLTFPAPARRVKLVQLISPSPHITPGKGTFLSTHHKRVFPLNFSVPGSPLDSYRGTSTEKALDSFPEPEKHTQKAIHTRTKQDTVRNCHPSEATETTPTTADLPSLAARPILERRAKQRSKSIDYEDFIIGGNSYNSHLTEKLYNPRVIRISERSKIKLFSLTQEEPKQVGTIEQGKREVAVKAEEDKGSEPVPTRRRGTHARPLRRDLLSPPRPVLRRQDVPHQVPRELDYDLSFTMSVGSSSLWM